MNKIAAISILLCGLLLTAGCTSQVSTKSPKDLVITINDGEKARNSTAVTLHLYMNGDKGPARMAFSNDNTTWSEWENFSDTKAWTLSSGDGLKTVYYKVKNTINNAKAGPVKATITLDTVAPTMTLVVPSPGATEVEFTIKSIMVSFSEAMSNDTRGSCPLFIKGRSDAGMTTGYWLAPDKFVCNLTGLLRPDVKYTIETDPSSLDLVDVAGNHVKQSNGTFRTRAASFQVLSQSVYHSIEGTYAYAVVKNTDTFKFENTGIDLAFKDSTGKTLFYLHETIKFEAGSNLIAPGDTAAYRTKVADDAGAIKSVSVRAGTNHLGEMNVSTESLYKDLYIGYSFGSIGDGEYMVMGSVKNNGTTTVKILQLVGVFYDASGGLVCIGGENHDNLGAGMTLSYDFKVNENQGAVDTIASYKLYSYCFI